MATGSHPSPKMYVKVAGWLGVVTAIEVLLSYMEIPGIVLVISLMLAAAVKFIVVVGYFMHLKWDKPSLRMPLITGFFLALVIYTIVLLNMTLHSTPAA